MKLSDIEFSKDTRKDVALIDFLNEIYNLVNNGRYQLRVVSSVPTWSGEQGEHLLYISGTVMRLYIYDITNSSWKYIEWNATGLGQSSIVATALLTAQTADISATTIYTPAASGLYRVSVYHLCTTAGGGTLTTAIIWTDDYQAQTTSPASNLDLSGAGNAATGTTFIRSTASAIQYSTSIAGKSGSPQYALFVVVERLY